jgi:hypothetical protein
MCEHQSSWFNLSMCDKLLKVMPAASIYGGPCLLIALALATLEGPSEIASDIFMSRSPLSLSGVGCLSVRL